MGAVRLEHIPLFRLEDGEEEEEGGANLREDVRYR